MARPKLSEMANVAEVVAAVAVVISLIYVGVQINGSTRAVRSAAANDANVLVQSWYLEIGGNRQMSDLFINTMRNPDGLSIQDEFQFLMMMHAAFLGFQNSFLMSQQGTLDSSITEAITTAILGVKDLPGRELYWRQRREYLHPEFAKYVEELRVRDTIDTVDIYRVPETERPR